MEKIIPERSTNFQAEKKISCSSMGESKSTDCKTKAPQCKKEVNSWDCSTPTDKAKIPNGKINDWDSSSECQETMVEPFDNDDNFKEDNWDSESDKSKPKDMRLSFSTFNSYSLSNADFSDVDKTSSKTDFMENEFGISCEKAEDDALLVEDLDEFVKNSDDPIIVEREESPQSPSISDIGTDSKKVRSKQSEGTPEDTTIWMIPKTERTQSGESISKLISSSDRKKLENLKKYKDFFKKTKSLLDVQKRKISQLPRSSRSEYLGSLKNNSYNFLPFEQKESDMKMKLETESKNTIKRISGCESFDRTRVFFTEYECRTMTVEKNTLTIKKSASARNVLSGNSEIPSEDLNAVSNESPPESSDDKKTNTISEAAINKQQHAESMVAASMDVISLPDMTGKNSFKKRLENVNPMIPETRISDSGTPSTTGTLISESWLLLDDRGQYQTVTRSEVSILLNGKSADAVLQGRKEHLISNATLNDTKSLKSSLSGMLTQESFQHVFKQDDIGGEDERKKVIDLERKVENTLFYIQPGTNFTASIRIIPVETEMIHLWKRTRDGGSILSSEVDLLEQYQDPAENVNMIRRSFVNEIVSEENELQSLVSAPTPAERRLVDPYTLSSLQNQNLDYSSLLIETRTIVDDLTNNFKTLQNRLDGEVNRSMTLQGEVNKLRLILKKYGEKNSRETIIDARPLQSNLTSTSSFLTSTALDNTEMRSKTTAEEYEESPNKYNVELINESTSMENTSCKTAQNTDRPNQNNKNENNEIITVNIYAMESFTSVSNDDRAQEIYSVVQLNLKLIENKMKRLQQENEIMTKQNVHLKRKLKEISMELETYLASTSELNMCIEEGKELESLRDQVCNLKLELETLKTLSIMNNLSSNKIRQRSKEFLKYGFVSDIQQSVLLFASGSKILTDESMEMLTRNQEMDLMDKNSVMHKEFTKALFSLKDWCTVAREIFQRVGTARDKLQEIGITMDTSLEEDFIEDPKKFSKVLVGYIEQTTRFLITTKNENFLYEQTLKDVQKESNTTKDVWGLDQVISGYSDLIDQCRKGQITAETKNKVMEDYFEVIMEKASLMEEMKILKTENEMLLESQLEHYEKLKQTMIALKDKKSEVIALESSQKLCEDERNKMAEVMKIYEEEKKKMEAKILEKNKTNDDLIEEMKKKDFEINDWKEKLKMAVNEVKNYENTYRLKDELVCELKAENEDLLASKSMKDNQIEILNNEIKTLEVQGSQLEAELTSTKLLLNESQNYITHLETLVNQSQESLDKNKQKLKESNQIISRLKNENDTLDKQHQSDLKLYNKTKDKLESCTEKFINANNKIKEWEEEREKLHKKYESLVSSEKEKSKALEALTKEYKIILNENSILKEKVDIFSKDRDELLKEQKDLINKHAQLSKDVQKLQEKYRYVKTECNDRTDLIRYLELMLKENLMEYNNRIVCLEQNISQIVEKIMVCKNGMREKHVGVDSEVRELRHQLNITYQERKELENVVNNYNSLMKHLKNEIQEREKTVDELHMKLSLEQQKAVEYENGRKSLHLFEPSRSEESLKIEQLESQISMKDNELMECKKELQSCQTNYENEKKKLELTIADHKSEIKRYQLRIEVMMKNLSNCSKNLNGVITDKRNVNDSQIEVLKKEIQEKNKIIAGLNGTINKYESELKLKESDLENIKKKNFYQEKDLKKLQNQIEELQNALSVANKTNEKLQKEKDEMAEKLFQSVKLIMEERSTRQAIESLTVEKERNYKNQIDQIKNELALKVKECESVMRTLEEKKKFIRKLQDDLKRMKAEVISLTSQGNHDNERNCKGNHEKGEEQSLCTSTSLTCIKLQNISPERMQSCLKELKEIREVNLELRKTEGQYQAKIVHLEDEIRDARLLIKELQGDLKTEKKSKKAFKKMILAAKMEIEKCLLSKQLMSVIGEKIMRHLDLSEIPSRELLSGLRLCDSSSSTKICT